MHRIRIAALTDTAQVSGPGRQLAALASSLPEFVELRVITFRRAGRPTPPYVALLERAGVPYTVLPESGPLDARLVFRLRDTLERFAPTVVQTHGYKTSALAFALRRTGATWPWVAFSHGETSENLKVRCYNWLERRVLGSADRVVVMSRQHRERLSHLGSKVSVVHNAVIPLSPLPEAQHRAADPLAVLPAGWSRPLLGVVGRLSPEKGLDVFLNACRELVTRGLTFTAIVAGDGPERRALEGLCASLGLKERVHFAGTIDAVASLYAELDVLVIPSRSEGLPNVLLEALRADVPVVASQVGAIPDVLGSSAAGILIPPGSSTTLADAIALAVETKDNPEARDARRDITERFSLERRVGTHVSLYRDLLEQHRIGWRS
jgi:glycosyltransferase involved in cell wall biosynthesis